MKSTSRMFKALLGGILLLVFALVGQAVAQSLTLISNDPKLTNPGPITTDGVNLYVGNGNNILSVPIGGGPATTLYAGATPSWVDGLTRIGTDLFWIDQNGDLDTATAIFRGSTSGGPITKIYSDWGQDMIVDGCGITTDGTKLYTTDEVQGRVDSLNPDGSAITFLGSRYGGYFSGEHVNNLTESGGILYITDSGRLPSFSPPLVVSIPKGGGSFTTLHSGAPFVRPCAIAVGNGTVFVADIDANTIWSLPITGGAPTVLVSGAPFVQFGNNGLIFFNNALYVTDNGKSEATGPPGAIYKIAFDVLAANDVVLYLTATPNPVSVLSNLTYQLTVVNSGPTDATGVTVTNTLPANVNLVSAVSSQGSVSTNGGLVIYSLGTLTNSATATATIIVTPTIPGAVLTNVAVVARNEADANLANNIITNTVTVGPAGVSIGDTSVVEGNVGTTNAVFTLTLNAPSAQTVTVGYNTTNGTALAGSDYVATNGVVSFAPGVTNQTIVVPVIGDITIESNEVFYVQLTNPANAVIARAQGAATIVNDDGLPGQVQQFTWNPVGSPQRVSQPFAVGIQARDGAGNIASNFQGAATLTGAQVSGTFTNGTILGSPVFQSSGSGDYTIGYAFTPNTNLLVTHVRNYWGTKVSIWTDSGQLIASQSVSSTPGSWVETPLTTPVTLTNGVRYRIAAYSAGGSYYYRTDLGTNFANGSINQSYYVGGDGFPSLTTSAAWYLVDLKYQVGTLSPVGVIPTSTTLFTNGVWGGVVSVTQLATNAVLLADDGNGHTGWSNPFDVLAANDVVLYLTATPNPVSVLSNLTYQLTVANSGPTDATGVTVTNTLPANVNLVSAVSSQGSVSTNGGLVIYSLGTLTNLATATATIIVSPIIAGAVLTNVAVVARNEADANVANNVISNTVTVSPAGVSISDVSVVEGNSGTTNAMFAVTLNAPSAQTVTVGYATTNGTAIAGSDYIATNGVVTFPPGITNQVVLVPVTGDIAMEPDETFYVNLSSPVNGVLVRSQAIGTIVNDDGLPGQVHHFAWVPISSPQLSGQSFSVTITAQDLSNNVATTFSGNVGVGLTSTQTTNILGGISHSSSGSGTWTLGYSFTPGQDMLVTRVRHYFGTKVSIWRNDGSLVVGQNVVSTPGTWLETPLATPVTLSAGQTYRVGAYTGGGSYYYRSDGGSNFANGIINQGYEISGDAFPANSDSVRWWLVDLSYQVGVGGSTNLTVAPTNTANFTNGVWSGNLTLTGEGTNVVLRAVDAVGHSGNANSISVLVSNDLYLFVSAAPNPAVVLSNLTYTLQVVNAGPDAATGVRVTNTLPAGVNFVSAVSSQGSCSTNVGFVVCDLGTLTNGAAATATIVVTPTVAGTVLINVAVAVRNEADVNLANNTVTNTVTVGPAGVSIGDTSVVEGNVGTTNAVFTLTLNAPSAQTVTVVCNTTNGTAIAGSDYVPLTNGIVTFAPGVTNQTIAVAVIGDISIESNEVFYVQLRNPTNGVIARALAAATIINDDGLAGQIHHFAWSTISSPQRSGTPFPVTITAQDVSNNLASAFAGSVTLQLASGPIGDVAIGNGVSTAIYPLGTYYHDQRTQVIYLSSEIGGACRITALAVNVSGLPGQVMNNFTIRLKHTPLNSYSTYAWEGSGWTVVYQANLTVTTTGWLVFNFSTPFDYDGASNLMVDFCFNNSSYTYTGSCLSSSISGVRALSYQTDSGYGDPLQWSGTTSPTPSGYSAVPNIRLTCASASGTNVVVSPTSIAGFVNGVWTGNLTLTGTDTNVVLRATDSDGHTGSANGIAVLLQNDLALYGSATPNPVGVFSNLTYTVQVINAGPGDATGVMVTNWLPSSVNLVSVVASRGVVSTNGSVLVFSVGTLTNGMSATANIVVTPTIAGTVLTNVTTVVRNEADGNLANNIVTNMVTVNPAGISIGDVSVVEGNSGTTNAVFTLTLNAPSAQTVTVVCNTTNGTAIAGSDYVPLTNGIVTFAPGVTNQTIAVAVIGDISIESNEVFYVQLRNPTNGVIARALAAATIINDDGLAGQIHHFAWSTISSPQRSGAPFPVTITAQDVSNNVAVTFSGNVGLEVAPAALTTNILGGSAATTSFNNGTFTCGYSFTPNADIRIVAVRHYAGSKVSVWTDSGILLFSQPVASVPGTWVETTIPTPVTLINGQTYRVGVYTGGTTYYGRTDMGSSFANGVIGSHYEISGDGFPTSLNSSWRWFFVDLSYQVGLGGSTNLVLVPTNTPQFESGVWSGNVTLAGTGTNVVLRAVDAVGHSGSANAISVLPAMQQPLTLGVSVQGHLFVISFTGKIGKNYTVQYKNTLNATNWSVLTNITAVTTNVLAYDSMDASPQRFYRVLQQPELIILRATMQNSQIIISFNASIGTDYTVQYAPTPLGAWATLTNLTSAGTNVFCYDVISPSTNRFYRVTSSGN